MPVAMSDQLQPVIRRAGWPLERVLIALAGSFVLLGSGLAALVSPWFLLLDVLVGVNQWLFVLFGACPASLAIQHVFALRSAIYPERQPALARHSRGSSCHTSPPRRSGRSATEPKS
jgi:hypothetical protein